MEIENHVKKSKEMTRSKQSQLSPYPSTQPTASSSLLKLQHQKELRYLKRYNSLMNRFAPKALQKPAQSLEKSPAAKFGITNMTKSPESTEHTGLPHFGDISSIQLDESDISSIKDELFVSEESYLQPWHIVEQRANAPKKRDLDNFVQSSMKYGDKITKILANSGVISPIKVLMKSPKSRPISEGDLDLLKYRSQTSRAFTKHKTEVAITHVKHIVVNLSPSKSQIDLTKHVKAMSYRSRLLKNN